MPLFLLNNWKWLLPTVAAGVLTILLGITKFQLIEAHLDAAKVAAAIAEQKIDAANLLLTLNAESAAKDDANAKLARDLDASHAQALADADASRTDFERRLADGLRQRQAQCRDGCSSQLPSPAPDPGKPQDVATGGDNGPGQPDFDAGRRLREVIKVLQADVVTCHAWAAQVGR